MPPSQRLPVPEAGLPNTILTLRPLILAPRLHVAEAVVRESLGPARIGALGGLDRRSEPRPAAAPDRVRARAGLAVLPSRGHGSALRAARGRAGRPQAAPVVAGDVPDRRGLLLHARVPAGHRVPGRRAAQPGRHGHPGAAHPVRGAAGLPAGGVGEPPRAGLDRHAGAPPALLAGQALRARAPRLRPHRLHHHHHALGRRRQRPPGGEPPRPGVPARSGAVDHPGPGGAARRGVPQGASPRRSGSRSCSWRPTSP